MPRPNAFWSFAILVPFVMVPLVARGLVGGTAGIFGVLPSLTTVGQVLVVALGVFALWVGLTPRGH